MIMHYHFLHDFLAFAADLLNEMDYFPIQKPEVVETEIDLTIVSNLREKGRYLSAFMAVKGTNYDFL